MEIFELFCCMLEGLDVFTAIANVIAFRRSAPNRTARRIARRQGETPPRRSGWTIAFLILTPVLALLSILVILKWTRVIWSDGKKTAAIN